MIPTELVSYRNKVVNGSQQSSKVISIKPTHFISFHDSISIFQQELSNTLGIPRNVPW